ncbi:hypothetical protein Q427_06440 [Halomonas sp. BC04]|nr:hypothetical protein Q427_06440 [Halomonas sp. BC04]
MPPGCMFCAKLEIRQQHIDTNLVDYSALRIDTNVLYYAIVGDQCVAVATVTHATGTGILIHSDGTGEVGITIDQQNIQR